MPAPVRFDFWTKKRAVIETKRNRQKITLSAFEQDCGVAVNAYKSTNTDAQTLTYAAATANIVGNSCTIGAWFKLTALPTTYTTGFLWKKTDGSAKTIISLGLDSGKFSVRTDENGAGYDTALVSDTDVPVNEWFWLAAVKDYDAQTLKLYLNGDLIAERSSTRGLYQSAGITVDELFETIASNIPSYVAEMKCWQIPLDAVTLKQAMESSRNLSGAGIDANLVDYINMNQATTATHIYDSLTAVDLWDLVADPKGVFVEDGPTLRYGASFVVAEWDITLTNKTSLKFPVVAPSGTTTQIVVRWVDDNGDTQRRYLYELDGVIISPTLISKYNGEKLPLSFTFEAWNIDGEITASLPEDLVIYTGITSLPTTDVDHTNTAAYSPTIDTTLAEPFPLTPFPLQFNDQQTY